MLVEAIAQAEQSSLPVRAAALLRIARVQTAVNPSAARTTFTRGLEAVRELAYSESQVLLDQSALLAGAVAPDLLSGTSALAPRELLESTLIGVMLDHGHIKDAVARLLEHEFSMRFPFLEIHIAMRRIDDPSLKFPLWQRAVEQFKAAGKPVDPAFVHLFQSEWQAVPPAEALTVLRDIVRATLDQPAQDTEITYGPDAAVQITSWRAYVFFEVLHILQKLDPQLALTLIAANPQLANAVKRFPKGKESIDEEAEVQRKKAPGNQRCSFILGEEADMPFLEALCEAEQTGNYKPAFARALQRYFRDSNPDDPNRALREFWPSAACYRRILYSAGKHQKLHAKTYLHGVPDDDLRLFAQIELAAALASLPCFPDTRSQYRPR